MSLDACSRMLYPYNSFQVEGVGEKCAATMDSLQSRLIMERETVVSFVTEVSLFLANLTLVLLNLCVLFRC